MRQPRLDATLASMGLAQRAVEEPDYAALLAGGFGRDDDPAASVTAPDSIAPAWTA